MQDIVKLVVEKTGISEPMAEKAVQTVLGFLKDKLPAGIGSQLDSFMGSNSSDSEKSKGAFGDILGGIGDIFGGKK